MAIYKITYIFNSNRAGWSETWYWQTSSDSQTINDAETAAIAVAAFRKNLLGDGAQLEAIRTSNVAIRNDSKMYTYTLDTVFFDADRADPPWNAILARADAGSLYRRQVWLRGVKDVWIVRNPVSGANQVSDPLNTAFAGFVNALLNNAFRLRVITKEAPDWFDAPITGVAADPDGLIKFTVAGFAATPPGSEVRSHAWVGPDKVELNKVFKVKAADATSVTVTALFADILVPTLDTGGKLEPRIIKYPAVTGANILRLAGRQTGRAFFVPLGRRRVKR